MSKHTPTIPLSQQAYKIIRHKIVTLALPPGGVIDEAILKAELGLGRTPIREALQRLSLEKLVTIVPRRGMFVTEIGMTDLQRLSEIRVNLESLAAELAAHRGTAAHWQEMAHLLDDLAAHQEEADAKTLIDIDEQCHHIIWEASDNQFLRDTLNMLYALSLRLWHYSRGQLEAIDGPLQQHIAIMHALEEANPSLAAQLMRQHIQLFQEKIQTVMTQ